MSNHLSLTEAEFWASVIHSDAGCWIWTRGATKEGYGRLAAGGKRDVYAHRWAYELTHGPIPKGMLVRHSCDNRRCINPSHLLLGTHLDNSNDKISRGRFVSGHALKTRCPVGHPYDAVNTSQSSKRPNRRCKTCMRERARASRQRAKRLVAISPTHYRT